MKGTKSRLIVSILLIIGCLALTVGASFAWFTDSITNSGNKIQAGTLSADLIMYDETEYEYVSIANRTGSIFNASTTWEPGYTHVAYLGVQNTGSLALNYNIILNITNGGLVGALEYALIDGAEAGDLSSVTSWDDFKTQSGAQTGKITAGKMIVAPNGTLDEIVNGVRSETDYFAIAVHMLESSGNEYEGKSVDIDVTVLIKQASAEEDGFGDPDYDDAANYPATTDNAQSVLDDAQSNAIINLAAGQYPTLNMSQTKNSSYDGSDTTNLHRSIKNVVITGEEGTVVDGISITAGHIYGTSEKPVTNPVTGVTTTSTANSYYSYIDIDGLTFRNITFTKSVNIGAWNDEKFASVKNVTFENCTFNGSDANVNVNSADNKLASFGASGNVFENIVFRNCTVKNAFQGIYIVNAKGVTVENCTFDNLGHNAIAIQSSGTGAPGGKIIIRDNKINNGNDRAIRFGNIATDADISITGNIMTNTGDTDGQLIKGGTIADGAKIYLNDNYWSGKSTATAIDSGLGATDYNPRQQA